MNKNLALQLLAQVGLYDVITSIVPMQGGRQHALFKVTLAHTQPVVIKRLNLFCYLGEYSKEHFNETEHFARHVTEQLTFALTAYNRDNEFIITEGKDSYLIYPWCEGRCLYALTLTHCKILGTLLHSIHKLPKFKPSMPLETLFPFSTNAWEQRLGGLLSQKALRDLILLANNCYQYYLDNKHKQVFSHRDLNLDNILWLADDQPRLIDWESAGYILPEIELLGMAFNIGGIARGQVDISLVLKTVEVYSQQSAHKIHITNELYIQSYASWFYWLDYCLSGHNALSNKEANFEISATLQAIYLMEKYKRYFVKE